MKVKKLIEELLNLPLDKDIKIMPIDNSAFLEISYIDFNKSQDVVIFNLEKEK